MWEESFYELSIVAGRQQGLITTAQAGRVGVDDAALGHFQDTGLLLELDWGVHQLASSSLGPRYAYPYAAWLAMAPDRFLAERPAAPADDVVLSHESACRLHGLGSFSAPHMVFTSPSPVTAPRATTIHVSRLAGDDIEIRMGVPVTTPHRTLLDLVRSGTDHPALERALTEAVQRDWVDLHAVHRDLVALAADHHFPATGPEFVHYFLSDVEPRSLSPRNLKSYTELTLGDVVQELLPSVLRVVRETHRDGAAPTDADETLSWDIAAEIVGRSRWRR
ncbi:hypothetical protein E1292_40100 [Nonomuraea deserti]|uniref:Transcriptional regulator n=1 Tax=Nonomuraea deserti TaxID=1848322 RepID=A0A4V2Y815_9ACTN|nr:hypothetical protein [Nonomuraea deserti]TDC94255.1 hypothetical protein E1292_40100 [Nonomuraea deserti]